MSVERQTSRFAADLDALQTLLEKQMRLVRKGNIRDIELLSEQASLLVEKIARTGVLELDEFKNRRRQLQKLYDSLCLAITAQKTETSEKLSRVRKGKRTLSAYSSSLH